MFSVNGVRLSIMKTNSYEIIDVKLLSQGMNVIFSLSLVANKDVLENFFSAWKVLQ